MNTTIAFDPWLMAERRVRIGLRDYLGNMDGVRLLPNKHTLDLDVPQFQPMESVGGCSPLGAGYDGGVYNRAGGGDGGNGYRPLDNGGITPVGGDGTNGVNGLAGENSFQNLNFSPDTESQLNLSNGNLNEHIDSYTSEIAADNGFSQSDPNAFIDQNQAFDTNRQDSLNQDAMMWENEGNSQTSDAERLTFDGMQTYFRDIEEKTGRKIPENQYALIRDALEKNTYQKLSSNEVDSNREYFNSIKNDLIDSWEKETGQKWPTYQKSIYSENGKLLKRAGQRYDAHHIIENSYGGDAAWWNIHPAKSPDEHQRGIHGKGSPARKIFR